MRLVSEVRTVGRAPPARRQRAEVVAEDLAHLLVVHNLIAGKKRRGELV